MRKEELNQIVADASPIRDAEVSGFDFERAEAELIQEIFTSPASGADSELATPSGWHGRRRITPRRATLALAAVAVAAVGAFLGISFVGGDDHPVFGAGAIGAAESNPRLLVTAPGWSVTQADVSAPDLGEMTFSNGSDQLEVHWYPAAEYKGYLSDRQGDSNAQTEIAFLGRPATMFTYTGTSTGSPDFDTLVSPEGKTFVEIRGDQLGNEDAYRQLIDTLQPTDVNTWLAAMPGSVVKPVDRAATVDEMLKGIPLPPGFDVGALKRGDTVSDRYQLGATMAGSVACDWMQRWTDGLAAGDAAKVKQAKDALATARSWPILREMISQGDYPKVLWDYADDLHGAGGFGPNTDTHFKSALGCPSP